MEKDQTFSKRTFLQNGFFNVSHKEPKLKERLWKKVVLLKVWSFSIVFHIPKEK